MPTEAEIHDRRSIAGNPENVTDAVRDMHIIEVGFDHYDLSVRSNACKLRVNSCRNTSDMRAVTNSVVGYPVSLLRS